MTTLPVLCVQTGTRIVVRLQNPGFGDSREVQNSKRLKPDEIYT